MNTLTPHDLNTRIAELFANKDFSGVLALAQKQPDASQWSPTMCHLVGMSLHFTGRTAEAVKLLEMSITGDPQVPDVHNNLAVLYKLQNKNVQAIEHYAQSIKLKPTAVNTYLNLSRCLTSEKRFEDALEVCRQAFAIATDDPEVWHERARVYLAKKEALTARCDVQHALSLRPDDPDLLNTLGNTYLQERLYDTAQEYYQRALTIDPACLDAMNNLSIVYLNTMQFEQAISLFNQAIKLNPRYTEALINLGMTYYYTGALDEARASYEHILSYQPDHGIAHWSIAMIELLQGNYQQAWPRYEKRLNDRGYYPPIAVNKPLWQGEAVIGKTVVLLPEQGYGDTLQFLRYAPLIKARGAKSVILKCPPPMRELLANYPGVDELWESLPADPDSPLYDTYTRIMSLPAAFQTTLDTIPPSPAVSVSEASRSKWRKRLSTFDGLSIGFVCAGSIKNPQDFYRSCDLSLFESLVDVEATRWICLQKDRDVSAADSFEMLALGDEMNTFEDLAAIISQLDLVISVDTATVHVAGLLGKPVWVLLPYCSDWRWLQERTDSPWYPSARLFRQPQPGDWQSVFKDVRLALQDMVNPR